MTDERVVRVGVIGCGYWGPNLIRNLAAADHAELRALCDLSEERLANLAAKYPGVRATTDYRDLLTDPELDAVVIATPIRTHHRLGLAALQHGKHVLIEKPLTASVAEAEDLVRAARAAGRVLMVGHTYLYNAAVMELERLVATGELGDIYYIDCARLNLGLFQGDIDVVWDLAPHDLSILIHLLGSAPLAVSAHGAAHVLDGVDDVADLRLRFPGNVDAQVRLSWLDACKVRRITVVGSKKMAVFADTGAERLRVFDRRVALRGDLSVDNRPQFDYHDGDIAVPAVTGPEPLRAETQHFIDCIRADARPISDGGIGLDVVRILEAASRSRRDNGAWIELPRALAASAPAASAPLALLAGD